MVNAKLPPVIYLAGPFRAPNGWEIEQNIRRAEVMALEVWKAGFACVCPHTNTRFYQGAAPDDVWLQGDLAIIFHCDGVLMMPDWERSSGTRAERDFAHEHAISVWYTLDEMLEWWGLR